MNRDQSTFNFDIIEEQLFLNGDIHNIRKMLPKLYDTQHEDVALAEKRFEEGKGYLFTNGTGTGKTYVGLGIAKRFYVQGKKNIIIIVPTGQKSTDWIEDAINVNLNIYKLQDTNDKGFDVVITTYANFYQNERINEREWDLIIYDESHYLNQNAAGNQTAYLEQHKVLANVPSKAREKARIIIGKQPFFKEGQDWGRYKLDAKIWDDRYLEETKKIVESTKVLFLSATPFAYHKSIPYADGSLFEISEKIEEDKDTGNSYNVASGFEKFLCENFGYRMRYNKVTIPEPSVDVNLLERNFFERFRDEGIMSTRVLELPYDYSRHFITIDSKIGELVNKGMEIFHDDDVRERYKLLSEKSYKKFRYIYVNQLLECIKAKEIHNRIQAHLDLGRKVVLFHSYNNSLLEHPFHFEPEKLLTNDESYLTQRLNDEIAKFNVEFREFVNLDLSELLNTREAIKEHFPQAKEFNGTVSKKKRKQHIIDFNKDHSDTNLLLVQVKAGKEGISLHDKNSGQQRVLINLGLPTAPTDAIQTEGRIYRSGLKSNAIYEYITLQTGFERIAFADKIAQRSKTAENLAMGNKARDLESAFKEGYINSNYNEPSWDQGYGGKENDRQVNKSTPFGNAKTYYFMRGKKTAQTKAKEGIDYFATPEPLGMSILRWLDPQPDERGCEPSAGHGAIARWFPHNTTNTFVEPSYVLSSELAINANGDVKRMTFENFHKINKFDFIAMNPPFGSSGKTAMEHVEKACGQLSYKGRLLAIVPNGGAMNKRLDKFFDDPERSRNYIQTGEIILPSCTFERAGTKVGCKIVRIEVRSERQFERVDLSYIEDINDFFDTIETLDF
jgi:ATP:corrinoid adenosyltransferase